MAVTIDAFDPATAIVAFDEDAKQPVAVFSGALAAAHYLEAEQRAEKYRKALESIRDLANARSSGLSRVLLAKKVADIRNLALKALTPAL